MHPTLLAYHGVLKNLFYFYFIYFYFIYIKGLESVFIIHCLKGFDWDFSLGLRRRLRQEPNCERGNQSVMLLYMILLLLEPQ